MSIKKIAEQAKVSIATVSRVLNHPDLVHPDTKNRIMKIIKELDYAPNPFAQGLTTGKAFTAILIVPTIRNPVFGQIAEGCEDIFLENGYDLMIQSTQGSLCKQKLILNKLLKRRIDGVILAGSGLFHSDYLEMLKKLHIPVVAVEYLPSQQEYSYVYIDDVAGTRLAFEHIINQGHKNIALITGNKQLFATHRRLKEAKRMLNEAGIKLKHTHSKLGSYDTIESGFEALQELVQLKPKPTAIYAFNDIMAIGAIKAINQLGLKAPDDIAIIGFDNIPMAQFCTPSLTTIHSPSFEMGQHAARLLLENMQNKIVPQKKMLLPVELIVRDSC
ncbi:MAG: hypothetical protein APF76_08540 [Desulfitibacter sp. BRH_c19]|nr:MAG: hypothetical protein APF76_08540 [Desulfitibacter sp. BRH_c19]